VQVSMLNHHWLTTTELGRNLSKHGVATAADVALISKSYFNLGDCKYALRWAVMSTTVALGNEATYPENFLSDMETQCQSVNDTGSKLEAPTKSAMTN
jgi:hypothetical protein